MTRAGILGLSFFVVIFYGCQQEEIILHGEITGQVTDSQTGQPLQSVVVKLNPANDSTKTGADGKYLFSGLTPGEYEIRASKKSYAEGKITATITSANTKNIDIGLDAIPTIKYSTSYLDFGFDLTSLSFEITKSGSGKVAYIFTPSKDWITLDPNSGDIDNETDKIDVTINRTGLTQKKIKEWIVVRTTYRQYDFVDTIKINVWFHYPIVFNSELNYGSVTDVEGNVYKTVQIGTQTFMAENLKTTKYNDNTPIPLVIKNSEWVSLTAPAYCWYENDLYFKTDFGALYNWYAVNTGNLCPTGWRVPSLTEYRLLFSYVEGFGEVGIQLKEVGTSHWVISNSGGNNSSGFTALPGGVRAGINGYYIKNGNFAFFWMSNPQGTSLQGPGWSFSISATGPDTDPSEGLTYINQNGFSVRCIKD